MLYHAKLTLSSIFELKLHELSDLFIECQFNLVEWLGTIERKSKSMISYTVRAAITIVCAM